MIEMNALQEAIALAPLAKASDALLKLRRAPFPRMVEVKDQEDDEVIGLKCPWCDEWMHTHDQTEIMMIDSMVQDNRDQTSEDLNDRDFAFEHVENRCSLEESRSHLRHFRCQKPVRLPVGWRFWCDECGEGSYRESED